MGYDSSENTSAAINLVIKPYKDGQGCTGKRKDEYVIDFDEMIESEASQYRLPFQRLLELVKPDREINRDPQRKKYWWRFGRSNRQMRQSLQGLGCYIATVMTAKHRVFFLLDKGVMPDDSLIAISLDESYYLGVLSSYTHVAWALAAGGRMATGNTPRYNKTVCFDPFPFPDSSPEQKQKIRELGDRLDSHRKQVQAAHPDITITGMYNLLEKLRAGTPFSELDRSTPNSTQPYLQPTAGKTCRANLPQKSTKPSSNASSPSTPNAPPKNVTDISAGCAPNIKPPPKFNPPRSPCQVSISNQKPSSPPSNSKNGRHYQKLNSQPSATCYALVAANGQ
jgi:hypothetical protein